MKGNEFCHAEFSSASAPDTTVKFFLYKDNLIKTYRQLFSVSDWKGRKARVFACKNTEGAVDAVALESAARSGAMSAARREATGTAI